MQRLSNQIRLNIERLTKKIVNGAQKNFFSSIDPIFEQTDSARVYTEVTSDAANDLVRPVISLTTISSRIERVEKTIKTIIDQSLKPQSVNLYISANPYMIDAGIDLKSDVLKRIADLGANIYCTENIGPYRKQYPVIRQLWECGAPPETPIVTVDDDVIYPHDILESLIGKLAEKKAVIAHRGRQITFTDAAINQYSDFIVPNQLTSLANLGTGRNGIAYRLSYFPRKIMYYVGPEIAPTADDLWCKWAISQYCIPTMITCPQAAFDPRFDFSDTEPSDKKSLFYTYNAKGANDVVMQQLDEFFVLANGISLVELLRAEL